MKALAQCLGTQSHPGDGSWLALPSYSAHATGGGSLVLWLSQHVPLKSLRAESVFISSPVSLAEPGSSRFPLSTP